jgi:hypothetical protein
MRREEMVTHVSFIPLPEGSGIDLDDGSLDEGVRAHEFVVRGVIYYGDNTGLAGDGL